MEMFDKSEDSLRARGVVIDAAFITSPESLALGLKLGRTAARATLLQRYTGFVEQLLLRIFNWDEALPLLVERVFARAIASAEGLDVSMITDRGIESWLLEHSVRVAERRLRWRRWFPSKDRSEPLPGLSAASSSELAKVYRVLGRLPAKARISFCLVYVAGLDPTDVARACNVSPVALDRQLSRAVAHVKRFATRDGESAKPRFRAA
jgi:DNA-directed RNA polymerase specialized sigma24 family protein